MQVSFGVRLLNQVSKPNGFMGKVTLWRMNLSHAKVTAWGLGQISIRKSDTILDVGCGGGKTVARLAAMAADGKVYGVDYSEESVAASRKMNREAIAAGHVEILHASVSQLPFPHQMFDVVTAVETHYYWPDLVADLREVLRVLKPGGTLAIIAEAYKGGKYDQVLRRLEMLEQRGFMKYAHLTVQEHGELLAKAGFSDVQLFENYDKGWLCAVGRKPPGARPDDAMYR